ncbi:MAG: hypothetical protein NWR72_17055 [Bacteroidia bacterium]|nr:hypothetical protein [Bacteroidia bacterium]
MSIKLIYLSEANLNDRMFIRDFVHNFKFKNSITVHAAVADVVQTRMITKRVSSLMSDALTYNRAFGGDQRGLVKVQDGLLQIDKARIEPLLDDMHTFLLGPLALSDGHPTLVDAMQLMLALRESFGVEEIITFADNPLSPLVTKKPLISSQEDVDKWLAIYDEEKSALARAYQLRPARLSSPANFAL